MSDSYCDISGEIKKIILVSVLLDLEKRYLNRYRWTWKTDTRLGIGLVDPQNPRLVSVSVSLILKKRDWTRYRSRWFSKTETGLGIGLVDSQNPRLDSVSVSLILKNRDWTRSRSRSTIMVSLSITNVYTSLPISIILDWIILLVTRISMKSLTGSQLNFDDKKLFEIFYSWTSFNC